MVFSRTKSPRRREVRRSLVNGNDGHWRSVFTKPVLWALLWVYLFTLVASLIALSGQNRSRYKIGQVLEEAIVSRVKFEATDEEATQKQRNQARARTGSVYNVNAPHFERLRESLLSIGRLAADEKIETLEQIAVEVRQSLAIQTGERLFDLRRHLAANPAPAWADVADRVLRDFAALPVLASEQARKERAPDDLPGSIRLRPLNPDAPEARVFDEEIIDVETDTVAMRARVEQLLTNPEPRLPLSVQRWVYDILMSQRVPHYLYDHAETEKRRTAAAAAVAPTPVLREPNQVLIPIGTELARQHLTLLDKEQAEYDAQLGSTRRWLARTGSFGLILLIGTGLLVYVAAYNQRILHNPVRGAALICLILLAQGLAVGLTILLPQSTYLTATSPVILVTMVLAIAYDRRFALAVGAISALLILVSLNLTVGFSFVLLTGVTLAASQLPAVKNRSSLVLAGWWTGLGMAVAAVLASFAALSLQVPDPFSPILEDAALVLVGAVVTGLFVQGMLPAIEKTFRVTTAMTLKDLNDASHPLLRRLAEEATGTYQHSLRIADMAEAAADAIDCNGLLCRVGAMYHDIGKVNKPEYFVENQGGGPNKHDKLRPAMSLLIIVGHVKDGIEMAKEYKLPKAVIHFIESHHGTTLVEYFYHAARKQSEGEDAISPTEFEFRYPGPKPQTKEAAILMLCDGVEGAARALPEPTPVRLEQLVNKMMLKRLMDGQFDECQITLQELHKVEQAVTRTLTAIYHGRIAYPKSEDEEARELAQGREPQASAS